MTRPEHDSFEDAAYHPHGAALLDCFRGDAEATLVVYQGGGRDDVPASFWLRDTIDPLEMHGVDVCRGRVLDLGAGAGAHALVLQARGIAVTAIDIAPQCITIMRERGVNDARVADLYTFDDGPFDTILCVCNGLDKVGRLADLPRFLDRMKTLVAADGQLVADSFDGVGELALQFEYKGRRGEPFTALHVDYDALAHIAGERGWTCELLQRDGAHYLVALKPRS